VRGATAKRDYRRVRQLAAATVALMSRLVLVLLAGLLVLSACGSDSSNDESVDSLLRETFASDKTVDSGRLNVQLDADVKGVETFQGPIRLSLRGPFESSGDDELPQFDFTLGITTGGRSISAGGVSTGDKGYLRFNDQAYAVSDEDFEQFKKGYAEAQKQAKSEEGDTPTLGALGIDPRKWLTNPQKVGDGEDVGGAEVHHITAGVDVPRLLDDVNRVLARASDATGGNEDVPQSLTEDQQRQIEEAVESAKVDVYTGKDDQTLRKLDINVVLRKTAEIDGGTLRFTLQIDDLNEDQSIEAPEGARPIEELTGSGAPQGGDGGGQAAPMPGGNDEYSQCLQEAGSDIAKLQECRELLGSGG
jgi:hypothetical protein